MAINFRTTLAAFCFVISSSSFAAGGFLGIDHMLAFDNSDIWSRNNQKAVQNAGAIAVIGGALWEGNESRLGKTFWRSLDSMSATAVAATTTKLVFRRQRPIDGNNPNAWLNNSNDKSFFSGETAHISSIVTPFILEYQHDTPAVWALAALPVYVGAARLKSQAHWQSDVLVGALVGGTIGYFAHERDSLITASLLPNGFSVGWRKKF